MGFIKKFVNHVGDVAGSFLGRVTGSTKNNELQQNNYENQTQIRVRDALKAGINPLAALNISSGYQPMFQNNTGGDFANMIDSIGSIAGGIGKHVSSWFDKKSKESVDLSLENQRLENDYIKAQIDHLRNLNPGITGGSYSRGIKSDRISGAVKTVPAEDWIEGEYPGTQVVRTAGGTMYAPASDVADSLDVEFGIIPNPYALEFAARDYGGRFVSWHRKMANYFNNIRKKRIQKLLDSVR